jgi:phospholipase/carboxylesterase
MTPDFSATRRQFLASVSASTAAVLASGSLAALATSCKGLGLDGIPAGSSRIAARPELVTTSVDPGTYPLNLGDTRDGKLVVPAGYSPQNPAPFLLALHGAGGTWNGPYNLLQPFADAHGLVLLIPESRTGTWDGIQGHFGGDVEFVDEALKLAFHRLAIDPQRVYVQGFSDGASYSLALGLANGDLFKRIIANSPGFIPKTESSYRGKPEIFISHGTQDTVLPINQTSRVLVPSLRASGYTVEYVEFDGIHTVPAAIRDQALTWVLR